MRISSGYVLCQLPISVPDRRLTPTRLELHTIATIYNLLIYSTSSKHPNRSFTMPRPKPDGGLPTTVSNDRGAGKTVYTEADVDLIVDVLARTDEAWGGNKIAEELTQINPIHSAQSYQTFISTHRYKGLRELVGKRRADLGMDSDAGHAKTDAPQKRATYSTQDTELVFDTLMKHPDLPPRGRRAAELCSTVNSAHSSTSYQTFIATKLRKYGTLEAWREGHLAEIRAKEDKRAAIAAYTERYASSTFATPRAQDAANGQASGSGTSANGQASGSGAHRPDTRTQDQDRDLEEIRRAIQPPVPTARSPVQCQEFESDSDATQEDPKDPKDLYDAPPPPQLASSSPQPRPRPATGTPQHSPIMALPNMDLSHPSFELEADSSASLNAVERLVSTTPHNPLTVPEEAPFTGSPSDPLRPDRTHVAPANAHKARLSSTEPNPATPATPKVQHGGSTQGLVEQAQPTAPPAPVNAAPTRANSSTTEEEDACDFSLSAKHTGILVSSLSTLFTDEQVASFRQSGTDRHVPPLNLPADIFDQVARSVRS